jgi:hypothetical protein
MGRLTRGVDCDIRVSPLESLGCFDFIHLFIPQKGWTSKTTLLIALEVPSLWLNFDCALSVHQTRENEGEQRAKRQALEGGFVK